MKLLADCHIHTVASGHAYSTIKENVEEASRKGLELVAITDHSPKMPDSTGLFFFLNLGSLPKKLFDVELLTGVELNIMDETGKVDLGQSVLNNLDVKIASLHIPCFEPTTEEKHTKAILNVMNNKNVNIIGHLGDPRYPINIKKIISEAKKTNTVIEINEKSSNPNGVIRAGGYDLLCEITRECIEQEVYMILGSDSHFYTDVGDFTYSSELIKSINVPEHLILNTDIKKLKEVLRIKK